MSILFVLSTDTQISANAMNIILNPFPLFPQMCLATNSFSLCLSFAHSYSFCILWFKLPLPKFGIKVFLFFKDYLVINLLSNWLFLYNSRNFNLPIKESKANLNSSKWRVYNTKLMQSNRGQPKTRSKLYSNNLFFRLFWFEFSRPIYRRDDFNSNSD